MLSASDAVTTRLVMLPYVLGGARLRSDEAMVRLLQRAGFTQHRVTSTRLGLRYAVAVW